MTLASLAYAPVPGRFDELLDTDGEPRAAWRAVARALGSFDASVLVDRQGQADRLLAAEGTGHLVHELALATDRHGHTAAARAVSHPWRLDPIPFVLDNNEFTLLADAAVQRMQVLEAVLGDCYGPRRLVADGVLPGALLHSLAAHRSAAGERGHRPWPRGAARRSRCG